MMNPKPTGMSINNVPIRFPLERWVHIVEEHTELAGYYDDILDAINYPEKIVDGNYGALIALKRNE